MQIVMKIKLMYYTIKIKEILIITIDSFASILKNIVI